MAQALTLYLPDEALERYRRGAAVARMDLDAFIAERLAESTPPLADDVPESVRGELRSLEEGDDEALRQAAECHLPDGEQAEYDGLLSKHAEGSLTTVELKRLQALGDEARRLTLKKAHALMLLKWRGHSVPSRRNLQEPGAGE
jgi:hypothetical protein